MRHACRLLTYTRPDLTLGRRVPDRAVLSVMTTFVPAENLQVARCLDLLAFTPDGPHSMHCVTGDAPASTSQQVVRRPLPARLRRSGRAIAAGARAQRDLLRL